MRTVSLGNITLAPAEARREASADAVGELARDGQAPLTGNGERLPLLASPALDGTGVAAAHASSRWDIELSVHGDLAEVAGQWRSFELEAEHTVFQSFDWLANWQRHVGGLQEVIPAIVVGRGTDGEILFILPLAVETSGALRRLTWLGWQLCDYNAPLLAGRFSARVSPERFLMAWRSTVAILQSDARFRFDLIDLQKMPECAGAQRNPFIDLKVSAHPSGAYAAMLGRDWEAFYAAKRSPSTRKRERRQLRQLAEHGKLRFVEVEGDHERTRTLATMFEQKSLAFARMGVDDPFLRPGHRTFFLAAANDAALQERIHVSRLDVGTRMVAASVGLRYRGCYYLILSSYDGGELSRFGPGRAHLHELLRHAIAQGIECFDFTVGDEPYKRDWSDTDINVYDHLMAVNLRGHLVAGLTAQFRRVKRCIKQSPSLLLYFA